MTEPKRQPIEEEIDLYYYWLIIKKRWKLIFCLFLVSVLGSGLWGYFFIPKFFHVTASINLGRIQIDGKVFPVASLADIQQLINTGSFIKKILSGLKLDETKYGPRLAGNLAFESKEGSESVVIKYDTPEPELGKIIVQKMISEIQDTFNPRAASYRKSKEAEMEKVKGMADTLEYRQANTKFDIQKMIQEIEKKEKITQIKINIEKLEKANLADRIRSLTMQKKNMIEMKERLAAISSTFENHTKTLLNQGKPDLARNPGNNDWTAAFLFANSLQQSLGYLSLNYDRIRQCEWAIGKDQEKIDTLNLKMKKRDDAIQTLTVTEKANLQNIRIAIEQLKLQRDQEIPSEIRKIKNEVETLAAEKERIKGIEVVAPPDFFKSYITSNRRILAFGSGIVSILVGVFLVVFLEWEQKYSLSFSNKMKDKP